MNLHNHVLHGLAAVALIASASAYAQGSPLDVPSDAKATYYVLQKSGAGPLRKIVTHRRGPSGESFSTREYDCKRDLVRYLGTGDTLAEMKASKPDKAMSPIVTGSIAYYVGIKACS